MAGQESKDSLVIRCECGLENPPTALVCARCGRTLFGKDLVEPAGAAL